jgi:hypothetical protein
MLRRLAVIPLVLPLAIGACAGRASPGFSAKPIAAEDDAARPTACDAELRAFVAISRLAKQHGDDWTVFEPAIEAMKDQILDCVQDSYGGLQSI